MLLLFLLPQLAQLMSNPMLASAGLGGTTGTETTAAAPAAADTSAALQQMMAALVNPMGSSTGAAALASSAARQQPVAAANTAAASALQADFAPMMASLGLASPATANQSVKAAAPAVVYPAYNGGYIAAPILAQTGHPFYYQQTNSSQGNQQ